MDQEQPQNPPQPTSIALRKSWELFILLSLMILGYSLGATAMNSENPLYPAFTIIPCFGAAFAGVNLLHFAPLRSAVRENSRYKALSTLLKSLVDFGSGYCIKYFAEKDGYKAYIWVIFAGQASVNALVGIFFGKGYLDLFGVFSSCFLTVVIFFDAKKLEEVSFGLLGGYFALALIVGGSVYFKPQFANGGVA